MKGRMWYALQVTALERQQQVKSSRRHAKPCIRFWNHCTTLQVSHFCFLRCKFYDSVQNNMYLQPIFLKIGPNKRRHFAWPQQFTPKNTDCVGKKYIPKEDSNSNKNEPRNHESLLLICEHGLRGKDWQLYSHARGGMVQTFVSFMSWITVPGWFIIFNYHICLFCIAWLPLV